MLEGIFAIEGTLTKTFPNNGLQFNDTEFLKVYGMVVTCL